VKVKNLILLQLLLIAVLTAILERVEQILLENLLGNALCYLGRVR
jgi:hypothetical protein